MTSTQVKHPWRATARTVFAALVGAVSILPEVLSTAHVDHTALGAQAIAVAGGVTRVLAVPAVENFLARYLPLLSAAPSSSSTSSRPPVRRRTARRRSA